MANSVSLETSEHLIRNFPHEQIQYFQRDLIKENWSYVYTCDNSEEAYNLFIHRFTIIFDRHFPSVKKKCNKRIRKPWINKYILRSINKNNHLYKHFINNKNVVNENKYKKQRNKVNNLIKNAKIKHFCNKLNQYKYDAKKTWTVINSLLNKPKHLLPQYLICDGKRVDDGECIATEFNSYFVNCCKDANVIIIYSWYYV